MGMSKSDWFSGWKCASGIAWILILALLGITVAEISNFGGVVQFIGDALTFTWSADDENHHYRVYLAKQDLTNSESVEACTTMYCEQSELEIETMPGLGYSIQVQAVSASGDTSERTGFSPIYLCLGNTESDQISSSLLAFLPTETELGPNFPNPFNSSTTIPFTIASGDELEAAVSLKIYNTLGQVVRTLVDENRKPGQYRVVWNGQNDQGIPVSTGRYVCILKAGEVSDTHILVYAK
jgi:hypothetical protein